MIARGIIVTRCLDVEAGLPSDGATAILVSSVPTTVSYTEEASSLAVARTAGNLYATALRATTSIPRRTGIPHDVMSAWQAVLAMLDDPHSPPSMHKRAYAQRNLKLHACDIDRN